ncbi:ABC transporter ATP-binding protein [Luteimicrobium subarcticum]|uniref:Iron complex transport system ATP-binding protein n=1 Tax=Luteimicrobium subarcticum TaxID=620910 RepID=A0A2M8WTK0_9MICO|nr:ATP-binding cassette domain-containing protein [Luteimicrobium subarcticum]PJI94204.1 iron complex transport system ATP-binding protein [Luteimicrobium subarcticum]
MTLQHPAPAGTSTSPAPSTADGAPSDAVLHLAGVSVLRSGNVLLDAVHLTVRAGEHWALLGPNGAGKSTMLGLAGALTHPSRGTVDVLGRRIGRTDLMSLRREIGHVDPRHPVPGPMTIEEVVLTGLTGSRATMMRWEPSAAQRTHVRELVDQLGLAGKASREWPLLSQGERGRALIARALVVEPRLLLLDEPATGLDVAAREQLLETVDHLHMLWPDLASVLVTHHLEELPVTTTHAALLNGGHLVAAGPVDDVLTSDQVSATFEHPIRIAREDGRWRASSPRTAPSLG